MIPCPLKDRPEHFQKFLFIIYDKNHFVIHGIPPFLPYYTLKQRGRRAFMVILKENSRQDLSSVKAGLIYCS